MSDKLTDLNDSSEESFALRALLQEVAYRRDESIRSSIRKLVRDALASDDDAQKLAKQAVDIYDKRSRLVHDGHLPHTELVQASSDAKLIVKRILIARFNQVTSGSEDT